MVPNEPSPMPTATVRGLIIQAEHRWESGALEVRLWGRLEDGRSFSVVDRRFEPYFYAHARDRSAFEARGATVTDGDVRSLRGDPLVRVTAGRLADFPHLTRFARESRLQTFEADLRIATRFLIDHGIRSSLEIVPGAAAPDASLAEQHGVDAVFVDAALGPTTESAQPRTLSFDIETDPRAQELLSIALAMEERTEVLLWCPRGLPCPRGATGFEHPAELLRAFVERVREWNPDVITGWNIQDFDLPVLDRIARRHGVALELGRGAGRLRLPSSRQPQLLPKIPGRVVLDGIWLLRGAFISMESYALDAVAREVLGTGKTITGKNRAAEILEQFEHERAAFVEYNLTDATLVLDILAELHVLDLAFERSRLTGLTPDRVSGSIAAFDYLYLSRLREKRVAAPTLASADFDREETHGGTVLESVPGLHENVLVFDFRSLYPSVIRTLQIDPWGYVGNDPSLADDPNLIVTPNGAAFRRQDGILTAILDELFPRRERAKREGDAVASQAIKILMNSFYGVLGTPACRFYSGPITNAITGSGRAFLLWCRDRFEALGHRVLYGDTDSLFVASGETDEAAALAAGHALAERMNRELGEFVRERWQVESRLDLEFEKLYLKLHLPAMRHSTRGARKRYVGWVSDGGAGHLIFTGVEAVRRDWTDLAHEIQRGLYERLFAGQPVDEYLRQLIREVRKGQRDAQLVYRKGLRKPTSEYTSTTPPHVAAARKMKRKPGRVISYVMTVQGPEPWPESKSPIDHSHYVEKQIRPIAEPVLELVGSRFDDLAGGTQQLELF